MIVNEPRFIILFSATLAAFFLVPVRWRYSVLIVSGLVFYGWYSRAFLALVIGLILLTYWASGRIGIWINIAALVGTMVYFKLQGGVGVVTGAVTAAEIAQSLAFPLGLSFLTFELIHFSIERQRGKIPHASLAGVAAFALYFPCRMAGPIKRYQPFDDSVRTARWSIDQCYQGLVRILWGFVKKVVLADVLVLIASELDYAKTPLHIWKGLLGYSLYLYLDFSAYSDIAIGLSHILGVRVPENFRLPYLSRNIREFWQRWHISLSSWLGDYVFLPLGKWLSHSRVRFRPPLVAVISYLVTMTVCGLWHGPSVNFMLWGLYHGLLLSLYAVSTLSRFSLSRWAPPWRIVRLFGRLLSPAVTFVTITVGWALFAMPAPQALNLLGILLGVKRSG